MDRDTRNAIERATQRARTILEDDFAAQLEGDFDVHRSGTVAPTAGAHLSAREVFQREKITSTIEHKRAAGMDAPQAVADYVRDAAFTTLNRFIALKMLEARELLQECITKGEQSSGYREFCGLAPGLLLLPDSGGYRLYIESLFDELSTEVKVLFDRRDPASVLWPKRSTFEQLLEVLNSAELADVWGEDETIGWVYQFFNSKEERAAMRDPKQGGSQAPRNSRELAIRNQFFTPRYVVQFLTDNTLGRIWYEMRDTKTALVDRCEYMVRKPSEDFAPRPKKDPRDLRVLDPACGSGHFLLYAFDLLLAIYEEAYADSDSPKSEATGKTLAADYPSLDVLRKAVPGLVLAHNLHGVDIDPRCTQIAQLALWMRAQRTYRDHGVDRTDRLQIRRSNIVVAEPLVADDRIAADFVARLGDAELAHVFTGLVDRLKLAGDLGLLLRVETLFAPQTKRGQTDLFAPPEERIRDTLAQFAAEEDGQANTRRRLFAEDAAQGMGLLATAEKKFDVVLMNPPFGAGSIGAKKDFDQAYPRTKNDLYAAFVERGIELLSSHGRLGAITSRTGFFLSSFETWRMQVLMQQARIELFADLGIGVMDDAMVEAAAYCVANTVPAADSETLFIRALETSEKASILSRCASANTDHAIFRVKFSALSTIPGAPFAYWVTENLRSLFRQLAPLESSTRMARAGGQTSNDTRYLRAWWEISSSGDKRWHTYLKGGRAQKFYSDQALVAPWDRQRATFPGFLGRPGRASEKPSNYELYFKPGITWPLRAGVFSPQAMPADAIFTVRSYAVLDKPENLLILLALLSSSLVDFLFKLLLGRFGFPEFVVGALQKVPIPQPSPEASERLGQLASSAWHLSRRIDTVNETSHAFVLPLALSEKVTGLDCQAIERAVVDLQRDIDDFTFAIYGIQPDDRNAIETTVTEAGTASGGEDYDEDHAVVDVDVREDYSLAETSTDGLLSWLVGVAFGRFDARLATTERPLPAEIGPFDRLPTRSPGMWPENEARILSSADIMVDDPGHANDIWSHVAKEASRIAVPEPQDLRQWLARLFFPLHIRMYSKSGRKAPIYWQLATPSASYSAWLYIHAFGKDTLFRVQNDYVGPKLAHEERKLEAMERELHGRSTAAERKMLAAQETFVEELRTFLDEVKRIAPLWKPNLDDGVIINFAPLWRLAPQHKPWQKEVKSTWDALCDGKYDWAHLAMHLWPERVVPKCAVDRSLAVAHGLEEIFWVQGGDGRWKRREIPTRSVIELVFERTSPAVKAALASLLEAPDMNGGSRARRGRRRAAGTDIGGSR